ncbi:MAG: hypothetical protein ABI836_01540 [Gemmatimonadota bacterium]
MTVLAPRLFPVLLVASVAMGLGCTDGSNSPEQPDPAVTLYDRIIFSRYDPASCNPGPCAVSLWTAKPDGSNLKLLVDSLNWPESPVVSPDGRTVAFENWARLYLVNAAGKDQRELVTGMGAGVSGPRWSPDGQWILFSGPDAASGTTQIYRIRPNGTGLELLTDTLPGYSADADWSPGGDQIVYVRLRFNPVGYGSSQWAVTMDLATRTETVVVDSTSGFNGRSPSWSPDGKTITFLGSNPNQPSLWAILGLDLNTGDYSFLADAQGNRPAIWSPDGTMLLYGAGDLWLMDADGGNQRPILADGMVNFEAFWTPASPHP